MTNEDEDDLSRKRRLPPTSLHQTVAEKQASDYLEQRERDYLEQLYKQTVALAAQRDVSDQFDGAKVEGEVTRALQQHDPGISQSVQQENLPPHHHHPDYRQLQRTHERVAESEAPLKREPERRRHARTHDAADRSAGIGERAARQSERADIARRQDEQAKSADRQAILRDHATEAPAEKVAEIKAEKLQVEQRRALWGDEFKTTAHERAAVEKTQSLQQSKGLGRSR
jgi:hypothetical protein